MRTLARLLLAALLVLTACDDDGSSEPSGPADQTYTAEGRLERLPREGADRREVSIAHDEIPEFVDRDGEQVGMHAMSMQFEVAPDVSLRGIAPGDRVRFTFEVRWNARPMLLVTRMEKL